MRISKFISLLILLVGLLTTTSNVLANCQRVVSTPTKELDMNLGRVIVPPDAPTSSVIATKTWVFESDGKYYYTCSSGTYNFVAKILGSGRDLGSKIYSTNIEGIGIRFSRSSGTININYPDIYKVNAKKTTDLYLGGSKFTVEVIKTSQLTGTGTITAGKYSSYDLQDGNDPILETYLSAGAITIISPSCDVLSGKNMNVDMGSVSRSDFKGIGSITGSKDFSIALQCNGGLSESGYVNIHTSFSGKIPTNLTNKNGVLSNEKTGSSVASGIGIQVTKGNTPIAFGELYTLGKLTNQQRKNFTIPLKASFYQYGRKITTGEVESHMVFNLTYD